MAPRRLPALVVSAQAAALALLLVVAAALGGVHASGGRAEPRRLAAGGSGTAAELVKDSPRSSAEGEVRNSALVVNDSAPSSAKGGEEAEAEAEVEAGVPPLQLIIAEEGRAVGAVCLDGSAPGFYYRKGYGSGRNNWVLFFEGGAWCSSHHACAHRATTILGSSALFLPAEEMESTERGMKGMFSANRTINPDFYNWNAAFFPYCDGGSFSGDREHIPVPSGAPLYLRGRRVADLLLKHLIDRMGLAQAHQVVVAGCSAGAVAVLLHCDRIRAALEAIAPSISVRCIADSSMFLDLPDANNTRNVEALFTNVTKMHNMSASLPPACLKDRPPEKHYECFMAEHLLPYISTPLFLINSNYDIVALRLIVGPEAVSASSGKPKDCLEQVDTCSEEEKKRMEAFRKGVTSAVAPLLHADPPSASSLSASPLAPLSTPPNGVFLFSCFQHGSIHLDMPWKLRTANGVPMNEAVGRWVHANDNEKIHLVEGSYPCNTCGMTL
ncbi:hypothetical protein CLOM_g1248 [Closterium sp. NIES-68]|nr:hypothetical protein CLOM_g1248 [Closterium sp. NIES-68]GJP79919.1 hypothetical protein CLOP_g10133 [Closterium sp. NIES-67]